MELVRIKNNTVHDQYVIYKGTQVILSPEEERTVEKALGDLFLQKCPSHVSEIKIGEEYLDNDKDNETVWIANVTGDPRQPEKFTTKRYSKANGWQRVDIDNPKRKPFTIKRSMGGSMVEYTNKDGILEGLNKWGRDYTIPPFQRAPFPRHVARWFLNRDALQMPEMKGACIKSRPKSHFEPDSSWPLDDIRSYFKLLNPVADLGPAEKEITHYKNGQKRKDQGAAQIELANAKVEILKQLYFYLVDPKVRLPSRAEFVEFRDGVEEEEELSVEEAARLLQNAEQNTTKQGAEL